MEVISLFQKLVQKFVKKRTLSMKVYYIIPRSYQLNGHPETFEIKLYRFEKRLSLRYNLIPVSPREKCPYLELFWSAFSRIRPEYGVYIIFNCGSHTKFSLILEDLFRKSSGMP